MAPSEQVPSVGLRGYRGRARYPAAPRLGRPRESSRCRAGGGGDGHGVCGRRACALLHTCLAVGAGPGQGGLCEEEEEEEGDWRSLRSFPPNLVFLRGVPLCLNVYPWKLHQLSFLYTNPFPFREDDLLIKIQATFYPY